VKGLEEFKIEFNNLKQQINQPKGLEELKIEFNNLKQQKGLEELKVEFNTLKQQINKNVQPIVNNHEIDKLRNEFNIFKEKNIQPTDLVLKNEFDKLKIEINTLKEEILKNPSNSIDNLRKEVNLIRQQPQNMKIIKDINELKIRLDKESSINIDEILKKNFEITNKKFEEVFKIVSSFDENIKKCNKIEERVILLEIPK
jgi:hypothetical protein